MQKIIGTYREKNGFDFNGCSAGVNNGLFYIITFLNGLSLEEAKKGAAVYQGTGINDFDISYGDHDEDYYIRFSFVYDWDLYIIEIQGQKMTDWDRVPQLKLSYENFDYVFKQWVKIKEENPKYIIITQDDSGWVGLQGKQELDDDEVALVEQYKRDHELQQSVNKK